MAGVSEKIKDYLNKNYASSIKNADGIVTNHAIFESEYFVRRVINTTTVRHISSNQGPLTKYNKDTYPNPSKEEVTNEVFYILEKSGCALSEDFGKLNIYLPNRGFSAKEIEEICGTSECDEHGIIS